MQTIQLTKSAGDILTGGAEGEGKGKQTLHTSLRSILRGAIIDIITLAVRVTPAAGMAVIHLSPPLLSSCVARPTRESSERGWALGWGKKGTRLRFLS